MKTETQALNRAAPELAEGRIVVETAQHQAKNMDPKTPWLQEGRHRNVVAGNRDNGKKPKRAKASGVEGEAGNKHAVGEWQLRSERTCQYRIWLKKAS